MGKHKSRWFINGKINYDVVSQSARLPGKSMQVAFALLYLAGLRRSKTFKLTGEALKLLGVSSKAASKALSNLEASGLISVQRRRGARPVVTLLGHWLTTAPPSRRSVDDEIPTRRVN